MFINDLEIHFSVDSVHPFNFIFCEVGNVSHRFEDEWDFHLIDVLENIIVASSKKNGHVLRFLGGQQTTVNNLEINRQEFMVAKGLHIEKPGKNLATGL